MTVTGNNEIKFTDVLVGEVWLCSGQSNMLWTLSSAHNAAEVLPKSDDPQMRFFVVPIKTTLDPEPDVAGNWVVCTPATAGGFSAVGYFFGHELRTNLSRPIGLIGSYVGGTPCQAWTSYSALKKEPMLQNYVQAVDRIRAAYPQASAEYPAKLASFQADYAKWQKENEPYTAAMKAWKTAADAAHKAGEPEPPRPQPATAMPMQPVHPEGGVDTPSNLFNAMIAPLIPYPIKGVIWYQGESNSNRPVEYRTLFPCMIKDWREQWKQGDFPFLFVQLAAQA